MFRRIWMLFWLSITIAACSSPSVSATLPPTQSDGVVPTITVLNTPTEPATTAPTEPATTAPTSPAESTEPAIQGQDCGQVMMLGPNPPRDATALEAENCFWLAFQQCSVATFTVTMRGVDTGSVHTFTLQKNDTNCTVVDRLQTYAATSSQPSTDIFSCEGLEQKDDGLHFLSCGNQGDIFIPRPGSQ